MMNVGGHDSGRVPAHDDAQDVAHEARLSRELNTVRRFALSARCTTRLIPAGRAGIIGKANFNISCPDRFSDLPASVGTLASFR